MWNLKNILQMKKILQRNLSTNKNRLMDIESELMGTEREAGGGLADANWHIQDR